ncbi:MAG: YgiT-type zinc finger protein [Paludibacteraceae bacterium]|nr:YgiT-type zinc finger protein [Paludibacteraceae bacterium]
MKCIECGTEMERGTTTSVTDLGYCLIIIRNVPCFKCKECNEISYSGDVILHLERIIEMAKKTAKSLLQEISIIDYSKSVA